MIAFGLAVPALIVDPEPARARLNSVLEGYVRALGDWRLVMQEAAQVFYEGVEERFESRGGGTWPSLAASTLSGKRRLGYAYPDWPLVATGDLMASATGAGGPYQVLRVSEFGLEIGLDWEPWIYHQEGTDQMPARPIFVLSDQTVVEITRRLERKVRGVR